MNDLNQIIAAAGDLETLAEEAVPKERGRDLRGERDRIRGNLERAYQLKKGVYEDYRMGLLSKEDYLRYKEDYAHQEEALSHQLARLERDQPEEGSKRRWIASLLEHGRLTELDRSTMAETVKEILIFEDGHIEIVYLFSGEPGILNDPDENR